MPYLYGRKMGKFKVQIVEYSTLIYGLLMLHVGTQLNIMCLRSAVQKLWSYVP